MAAWTGWVALALVPLAGVIPLVIRLRRGKRAAPESPPIRWHVVIGLAVSGVAFIHTLLAVPALGSPSAVGGGELALAFGALAFLVLLAHTGLGFQLRDPRLRRRGDKRRQHLLTAGLISLAVALHVVMLMSASP